MARKLFLEDSEIDTILSSLNSTTLALLSECKEEGSGYKKSALMASVVDSKLQSIEKLMLFLETIKGGKLKEKLAQYKSRL